MHSQKKNPCWWWTTGGADCVCSATKNHWVQGFSPAAGRKHPVWSKINFYNFFSNECSVFRRDDPARTNSLNTEHSKRYMNAMPNQKTVLHFDVWVHEVSHERGRWPRKRPVWSKKKLMPCFGQADFHTRYELLNQTLSRWTSSGGLIKFHISEGGWRKPWRPASPGDPWFGFKLQTMIDLV